VAENNPVRVIDAFIDELDLGSLGFAGMEPEKTGRPGYHPATLLKLHLTATLDRAWGLFGEKKDRLAAAEAAA
jgi:transposase